MDSYQIFYEDKVFPVTDVQVKKFEIMTEDKLISKLFFRYSDQHFADQMHDLLERYFHEEDLTSIRHYFTNDILKRKKQRWSAKAVRDLRQKKVKNPKELYALYVAYMEEMPKLADNKIKAHIKDVDEWAEDPDTYLYEYPFFEEKTRSAIQKALNDDLVLMFVDFIEKEIKEWIDEEKDEEARRFREYPYNNNLIYDSKFHRQPLDIDGVEVDEKTNQMIPYKEFKQDKHGIKIYAQQSEVANMMAREFNLDTNVYDLDPLDADVLAATLSLRDHSFSMGNLWVSTTMGDLVRSIFPDQSPNRTKAVMDRIYKLLTVKYAYIAYDEDEELTPESVPIEGNVFGFFDNFKFMTDKAGTMHIQLKINEEIYNSMINSQTLKIYREQIDNLDPKYKPLLLYLQKERIAAHKRYEASGNKREMAVNLTLRNFLSQIRLQSKRKANRVKEIEQGLKRLQELNIIVYRFSNNMELFVIDFYPLTEEEVSNIISENEFSVKSLPLTDISHTKTGKDIL